MEISAQIVVQSHLSDACIELNFNKELADTRINFVKYLVNKLGGNLDQKIKPEELYEEFKKERGE